MDNNNNNNKEAKGLNCVMFKIDAQIQSLGLVGF